MKNKPKKIVSFTTKMGEGKMLGFAFTNRVRSIRYYLFHLLAAVFFISTIVLFVLNFGINNVSIFEYTGVKNELDAKKYNLEVSEYQLQLATDREVIKQEAIDRLTDDKEKLEEAQSNYYTQIYDLQQQVAKLTAEKRDAAKQLSASEKKNADQGGQVLFERDKYTELEKKYALSEYQLEQSQIKYFEVLNAYNELRAQFDLYLQTGEYEEWETE